jgi:hypothetical protein
MHQYIIGATHSVKSNYLMTLARSEEPFCFIDKHGTTARQIADAMLCIYWRPADLDFPIGLNPLQNVPPDERWRVKADIVLCGRLPEVRATCRHQSPISPLPDWPIISTCTPLRAAWCGQRASCFWVGSSSGCGLTYQH